MDETYFKIKNDDVYLYRAVDKMADTMDCIRVKKRNKKAAFSFFCKAISQHGLQKKVTII
jgi:transposase-like protein